MKWTEERVAVMDFEGTTSSGVVEYGVVVLRGAELLSSCTELCSPTGEVSAAEARTHGLHRRHLRGVPPFRDRYEEFVELRSSVRAFAAHHASVEDNLLKAAWPYRTAADDEADLGWGPWVDTRRLYQRLYPDLKDCSLGALVDVFGLRERLEAEAEERCPPGRGKYHCALFDALASALLLVAAAEIPEVAEGDFLWLLQAASSGKKQRESIVQRDLFG